MGRGITRLMAATFLAALLGGCAGDGASQRIDWTERAPLSGTAVDGAVEVSTAGGTLPLAVIENPGIGGTGYVVRGEVAYDVTGTGYLEMWSLFADGGAYFSRTLDTAGPLAALTGASEARPFELPFSLDGATPPERLEINVVLPEGGSVRIGPLELASLDADAGAWWSDTTGNTAGAVMGTGIGLIGALIGILAGLGRARRLVLGVTTGMLVLGGLLLAVGLVAVAASQPFAVFYPPLLGGGIVLLVFGFSLPGVRKRYQDHELRRMAALDLR